MVSLTQFITLSAAFILTVVSLYGVDLLFRITPSIHTYTMASLFNPEDRSTMAPNTSTSFPTSTLIPLTPASSSTPHLHPGASDLASHNHMLSMDVVYFFHKVPDEECAVCEVTHF